MENRPRLLGEDRRRRILNLLKSQEAVTVDELVRHLGVSAVTIRADLDSLDRIGALLRSHGGALKRLDSDVPLNVKQTLHHAEKVRIGKRAAELVGDGGSVIFDSGTTSVDLDRNIRCRGLKAKIVITNALNVALELSHE